MKARSYRQMNLGEDRCRFDLINRREAEEIIGAVMEFFHFMKTVMSGCWSLMCLCCRGCVKHWRWVGLGLIVAMIGACLLVAMHRADTARIQHYRIPQEQVKVGLPK